MLPGFPELSAYREGNRFVCAQGATRLTFYTERSAQRDLQRLTDIVTTTVSAIPVIVAPYADTLAGLFDRTERFVFIAPAAFTKALPQDERLVADAASLSRFINAVQAEDNFVLHILPQWQSLSAEIGQSTRALLAQAAVRLKTIKHFSRLWPLNFRLNLPSLQKMADISKLNHPPDVLALAGPSLSLLPDIPDTGCVWCADTALPVLLHRGIRPAVVFTLDAGYASREHFCGSQEFIRSGMPALVADPLSAPAVLRLPFTKKYTYANSHPLVQQWSASLRSDLTEISNPDGNVGGLMLAVCSKIFPDARPKVFGHDRGHRNYVSHSRGTAYYRRSEFLRARLNPMENYAFKLSKRYGKAPE